MMKFILQITVIFLCLLQLTACSFNKLPMSVTEFFIERDIASLNAQTNLQKAKFQLSKNMLMLEQMITEDKQNKNLHIYAAQAYYSFAFAFLEDVDLNQAFAVYYQAYQHACAALALHNISAQDLSGKTTLLRQKVSLLTKDGVNALYWVAISWAKLIEIKQPNLLLLSQLHKTAILMKRVIELDETYFFSGADLFFAVYYSSLPVFLGGDNILALHYFDRARRYNKNRLLIVDYLQAKHMRQSKKASLYLKHIVNAPHDLYPEQALMNTVVKQKAKRLLKKL